MPVPGQLGQRSRPARPAARPGAACRARRSARPSRSSGPRTATRSSTELVATSSTTRSLAVAVRAQHRHAGGQAGRARGRGGGSRGGSRGPSRRCSAPRRSRAARCGGRRSGSTSARNRSLANRSGEIEQEVDLVARRAASSIASQSSRFVAVDASRRGTPMRSAASIWLRMSASSGETSSVGPAPAIAQHAGGDEVDGALAPAGALHEQHALAIADQSADDVDLIGAEFARRIAGEFVEQRQRLLSECVVGVRHGCTVCRASDNERRGPLSRAASHPRAAPGGRQVMSRRAWW